eukprot:TRINITY_DN8761_c0_g1_i2.p1 TRINITY_DN8761_c0_g1~~TRINITY_DN8761_c0_g1_i2.p1  ORF type:complete len:281 (+),score=14.58 TRINITY_DN8761_c0_g1_i2:260-1102(+)
MSLLQSTVSKPRPLYADQRGVNHKFLKPVRKHFEGTLRRCMHQYVDRLDSLRPALGAHLRDESYPLRNASDRRIIIDAGFGTTGTKSLMDALKSFGLGVQHWHKGRHPQFSLAVEAAFRLPRHECIAKVQEADFASLLDQVEAVMDTPVAEVFIDLFLSFPNAKFILTTRASKDWASSRVDNHSNTVMPIERPCGLPRLGESVGNFSLTDIQELFDAHNDLVRCAVPKHRLYEINVFDHPADNIMTELSHFLGLPPPVNDNGTNVDGFPVVNKSAIHLRL